MTDTTSGRPARRAALRRLAAAAAAATAWPASAGNATDRAPLLPFLASDGMPVLADGAPWRVLYLDFWASWCAPCRQSFPWLNDMHDRHAASGLRIVGICLDRDEEEGRAFVRRMAPRFAIAYDPEAHSARRVDLRAMPTSLIVAPDRRILHRHRGFRLDDRGPLERHIVDALT